MSRKRKTVLQTSGGMLIFILNFKFKYKIPVLYGVCCTTDGAQIRRRRTLNGVTGTPAAVVISSVASKRTMRSTGAPSVMAPWAFSRNTAKRSNGFWGCWFCWFGGLLVCWFVGFVGLLVLCRVKTGTSRGKMNDVNRIHKTQRPPSTPSGEIRGLQAK